MCLLCLISVPHIMHVIKVVDHLQHADPLLHVIQGKISLASSDDIALSLSSKSIDSDYDVPRFRDHPQVRN